MKILIATFLLSIWGLLIYTAPTRKRYGRRAEAGHSEIDGEENSDGGYDAAGDCGGGDGGGGDGGGGGD